MCYLKTALDHAVTVLRSEYVHPALWQVAGLAVAVVVADLAVWVFSGDRENF